MGGYQEEQDLKARRKAFGRRFRMTDAEEKHLKEQNKQNMFTDNIKYRKSLKRK